jgi:penicillin amidase
MSRTTQRSQGWWKILFRSVARGVVLLVLLPAGLLAQETLVLEELDEPVEILKDRWGIAHIYAQTEHDLFFSQGWSAARDRLFQLETWRRQATGTAAEILGERELQRDIGARLFKFRGDLEEELRHYHPHGVEIIRAFVDGINAYVAQARENPDLLSVEFRMMGIQPGFWTPEVVISRHQGLLSNVRNELRYGRAVAVAGPEAVKGAASFQPSDPPMALDEAIDKEHLLESEVLALYNAFRRGFRFEAEDVLPEYREAQGGSQPAPSIGGVEPEESVFGWDWERERDLGSNNWVVAGGRSASGFPLMANDPHRSQAAPSLRYWAHLVGPGWNVIGGGEPVLPGISIGHNEFGAWGLTIFATDTEDLYVYELNPSDPELYRYGQGWERMTTILDTIPVRNRHPEVVKHRFTRHGPVVFSDEEAGIAYAVRAAWMEVGGAPYLASLRMNQAESWDEFREACSYSHLPGENMVWADPTGVIGWQAVGIAPIRRNWSGLVPVPGDGRFEWDGFLPIPDKPHLVDPSEGYFASANNYLIPKGYPFSEAVGFEWSDPYRWLRAVEVLGGGRRFSLQDMAELQTDELSIPARTLVSLLDGIEGVDPQLEGVRQRLLAWDFVLDRNSSEAGVYVAWERHLREGVSDLMIPEELSSFLGSASMRRVLNWLQTPSGAFGEDPVAGRDALLLQTLEEAKGEMEERFGSDPEAWVYGQADYKHIRLRHPLSRAVSPEWREKLEVGPAPRGGNSFTLNQTGGGDNQSSGASFRILVDTGDWDMTLGMNNPGQGGHPDHPHYADLFQLWAQDRFHPVFYSREKVESVTGERIVLTPGS